ncbi:MAG: acireductone synthase [Pseudomonadota bacterium]
MISAIITDVEGTTSSLSFVKDVLFPYAARELPAFVREQRHDPAVRRELASAAAQAELSADDIDAVVSQLLRWIADDRKVTPLKNLQGMIWEFGYVSGAFKAHLYEDAERCLRRWHAQGLTLYVYSSGSIHAQKLFFGHSVAGDLRPLFSGYFDTTTGPKFGRESYQKIVEQIAVPAQQALFLSDVEDELDAAASAGLHTARLVRSADYGIDPAQVVSGHPVAASFDDIDPANPPERTQRADQRRPD